MITVLVFLVVGVFVDKFVLKSKSTMYCYLTDANDVFRDINVAELDKDTNQAQLLLKRASLRMFWRFQCQLNRKM